MQYKYVALKQKVHSGDTTRAEMTSLTLVLYTGGTFGMKHRHDDDTGGLTPAKRFEVSDELDRIVPLSDGDQTSEISFEFGNKMRRLTTRKTRTVDKKERQIKYDFFEFENLIDSSLMNQDDWKKIAELIQKYYNKYSGFVVVMGTDTMAYASSALSFMLENLSKPVVFTGAQIPIFDARSDGPENLLCSLVVSTLRIPEVLLCFNKKAFRGNRVVKIDCVELNAYDSPNFPPLVTLDTSCKVADEKILKKTERDLQVREMCPKGHVGLLVIYPGITTDQVLKTVKNLYAVVLLTFGSGNIDDTIVKTLSEDQSTRKRLYVNVTQCLKGSVTSAYAAARELGELAVKGNDITTEAAFTKLSYVMAKETDSEERKKMMKANLRGEMTVEDNAEENKSGNN